MKITMVAAESRPFLQTGGLGDVVYSLSRELVKLNHDVSIIMPFYSVIRNKKDFSCEYLMSFNLRMSWRNNEAKICKAVVNGITYYFIDADQYFLRSAVYGENDDNERFAFFVLAAKELMLRLNKKPDIIHIHDWHVGVLPCVIKEDRTTDFFKKTKFVYTIHNPAFQGCMDKFCINDFYNLSDSLYYAGHLEFKGSFSSLKTGIMYSDIITTVSPTHREELLSREGSMGLCDVLRLREFDFYGILNGIDYEELNPERDQLLYKNYSISNFVSGKKENKKMLLNEYHLKNVNAPLYSLVSRLTWQKGIDLVIDAANELVKKGANVLILGSGDHELERRVQNLRDTYPDQVAVYIGYNEWLSHKVYAASDFFLMPSLFEPCGLAQMISMRYGTIPIVRSVGGLKDSVYGYNGENKQFATGFKLDDFKSEALINVCNVTLDVYYNKDLFRQLEKNAMKMDNSWNKSALNYLKIYQL